MIQQKGRVVKGDFEILNSELRAQSLELRYGVPPAGRHGFTEKAFPRGGRWRGTRRMRGKCPEVAPSSVTCGDSFPQRGKPFIPFTRNFHVVVRSRAGHCVISFTKKCTSRRTAGGTPVTSLHQFTSNSIKSRAFPAACVPSVRP